MNYYCPFCRQKLNFKKNPQETYSNCICEHGNLDGTMLALWAFTDNKTGELLNYFLNFTMDGQAYGLDTESDPPKLTLSFFKQGIIDPFITLPQFLPLLSTIEDYQKLFKRYLNLKAFL